MTRPIRPEGLVSSPAFADVAVAHPGSTTMYARGQNAGTTHGACVAVTAIAAVPR